ncbi:SGNH/GDSL hydrolase family protein, partial [Gordonia otitidis]
MSAHVLGRIHAALATAGSRRAVIVTAGSSTTSGHGLDDQSHSWVDRWARTVQAAYPRLDGRPSQGRVTLAGSSLMSPDVPGVVVVNAGVSGTTSANYLDDTSRSAIATLRPILMTHMVGSNDLSDGVDPAVYERNIRANLTYFADASPATVHVLVHSYHRMDTADGTISWTDYRDRLCAIASDAPDSVLLIDGSEPFSAAGLPEADSLHLIASDAVHMTVAGHDLLASTITAALRIPVPAPTRADGRRPVWCSDTFSGCGEVVGAPSDSALGGGSIIWSGEPGEYVVADGALRNTGTRRGVVGIEMSVPDYELTARLAEFPTGEPRQWFLDVRRQSLQTATAPDAIRCSVAPDGMLRLLLRVDDRLIDLAEPHTVARPG